MLEIADEILANLDAGIQDSRVNMGPVGRAESLMWVWILGAYEIIRTMQQAQFCFAARVHLPLKELKSKLATVRMPAAKIKKARQDGTCNVESIAIGY